MLHDVVIVGAGPVGATLALALAPGDLDIVVVDARAHGEILRADRTLALSHGARLVFERLGVWSALAAVHDAITPIVAIDVSQSGGFGMTRMSALEHGLPALGYVVSYNALQGALDTALERTAADIRYGATVSSVGGTSAYAAVELAASHSDPILARLVAVADGAGAAASGIRRERHEYREVALIAKVWREAEHGGIAYERFTPLGPMALLPEGDHYGLVWTMKPARATELLVADEQAFIAQLMSDFGPRAGVITRVAERRVFPLVLEYARDIAGRRHVVLGNAAQTLHPVAGQGFNLGLRDAFELAQHLLDTPRSSIGDDATLARYTARRRRDRLAGITLTNGLVSVFGGNFAALRWTRGLALTLLDALPPAKRAFTHSMLFGL
jgi:2-octaprenyl-6-methoxyphenol hydroxylase